MQPFQMHLFSLYDLRECRTAWKKMEEKIQNDPDNFEIYVQSTLEQLDTITAHWENPWNEEFKEMSTITNAEKEKLRKKKRRNI